MKKSYPTHSTNMEITNHGRKPQQGFKKKLGYKRKLFKSPMNTRKKSGQIIIFLQPRFPWNKGSHFPSSATFWGPRSCEMCSNQSCLYVDRKYQLSSGESWDFMSAIYGLPTNECMWFPWQSRVYIYVQIQHTHIYNYIFNFIKYV